MNQARANNRYAPIPIEDRFWDKVRIRGGCMETSIGRSLCPDSQNQSVHSEGMELLT
jgi:hypothetical protein